jgi:nucleotide-binding universal stress UspA family protein
MAQIKRVMLPTGFSQLSKHAAEYVRLLVPKLDAELDVVHVVSHTELVMDPGMPGVGMPIPSTSTQELLVQSRLSMESFIREVIPELSDRTRTFTSIGGIVDELLKHVNTHAIDLIIMATHADGMLKRLIWGSIGKSVLEQAPCPVLLVPVKGAKHA